MEVGDAGRSSDVQIISHFVTCDVNDIPMQGGEADDDLGRRRPFYVGLTCGSDHLFVTVSGSGPIGQDLLVAR